MTEKSNILGPRGSAAQRGRRTGVENHLADAVGWIVMDRAGTGNALTLEGMRAFAEALSVFRRDERVRAVAITGAGETFCLGGDLEGERSRDRRHIQSYADAFARIDDEISLLGKPVIAKVNGNASAGGVALMAACDIAVAARHARFSMPEIKGNLFPLLAMGVLQSVMPAKAAWRMFYSGEEIDGKEALSIGLVTEVVDASELDERVGHWIDTVSIANQQAVRAGRTAFFEMRSRPRSEHVRIGGRALEHLMIEAEKDGVFSQQWMDDPGGK